MSKTIFSNCCLLVQVCGDEMSSHEINGQMFECLLHLWQTWDLLLSVPIAQGCPDNSMVPFCPCFGLGSVFLSFVYDSLQRLWCSWHRYNYLFKWWISSPFLDPSSYSGSVHTQVLIHTWAHPRTRTYIHTHAKAREQLKTTPIYKMQRERPDNFRYN